MVRSVVGHWRLFCSVFEPFVLAIVAFHVTLDRCFSGIRYGKGFRAVAIVSLT